MKEISNSKPTSSNRGFTYKFFHLIPIRIKRLAVALFVGFPFKLEYQPRATSPSRISTHLSTTRSSFNHIISILPNPQRHRFPVNTVRYIRLYLQSRTANAQYTQHSSCRHKTFSYPCLESLDTRYCTGSACIL